MGKVNKRLHALARAAERVEVEMTKRNAARADRMPGCKFPHCLCNPVFKVCENRELEL